jgi:hypothetical protein
METIKTETAKIKRKSKGQRAYIRRAKQEARKAGVVYRPVVQVQ